MLCMQGAYRPASGLQGSTFTTSTAGRFTIDQPALALYNITSTGTGVCVDAVSNSEVAFPYTLTLPPVANVTVTAISLLTVPARSDQSLQTKYPQLSPDVVPAELWTEVYAMFGYVASGQVRSDGGRECNAALLAAFRRAYLCFARPSDTFGSLRGSVPPFTDMQSATLFKHLANFGHGLSCFHTGSALPSRPCRSTTLHCQGCQAPSLLLCWVTAPKPWLPSPRCKACSTALLQARALRLQMSHIASFKLCTAGSKQWPQQMRPR